MSLLVHNVYFALTDKSDAARQKLIAGCRKYLTGHPGTGAGGFCSIALRREAMSPQPRIFQAGHLAFCSVDRFRPGFFS